MMRIGIVMIAVLALVLPAVAAGAQASAMLNAVTGKVEIQNPGERTWHAATVGMQVPLRATIATGFNGRAVLQMGATTVTVGPVTRLRVDELSTQNNVVKTNLALPVGRIRAVVKSTGGAKNDFTVRSPLSTAAVRGTGFDTDGERTAVFEAVVTLLSQAGISIPVNAGEAGVVTNGGSPSGGWYQLEADMGVNSSTSTTGGGGLGGGLPGTGYGTITINWQ
jgi:hypothetical protein